MSKSIKQDVINAIKSVFDEKEFIYTYDEERSRFLIGFSLNATIDSTRIVFLVKEEYYVAYATVNLAANKNIDQVYEFVSRANSGILNGNFELDSKTGNIRYKIFVEFGDQIPSKTTILHTINIAVTMVELYIDGLLKVITGAASAQVAINEIEHRPGDKEL